MKTFMYKYFVLIFIGFFMQSIKAQNPNWSVNSANYQYSMTFTTFLNVNGTTLTSTNDKIAAFVNGEIRGVSNVVFVASENKYVAYLSVYANLDKETINFKIYNSTSQTVVNIDKTEIFTIDGNIGGIFQSYSIASPQLSSDAIFNSFVFLGITAVVQEVSTDKINIVLPENTAITSLKAVFNSSVNSNVFVKGVLQESGNAAHDFTKPIIYKVLSENEATLTIYEVSVSTALNQNPTTVIISSTENVNTNSIAASLDVIFSKVVLGFEKSDFILENAVISSFSTSDLKTYNIKVIPFSQGVFSVQVPASVSLDENNNQNEQSNKIILNYDITKPVISSVSAELDESSKWFLVTFNEEVVNVDITDFELIGMGSNGLQISKIATISSSRYKVEVSNSNSDIGVVSLQLKNTNDIKDKVGNLLVFSEFESYFLNNEVLSNDAVFNSNSFSMYPNPADSFIRLRLKGVEIEKMQVYSLKGKKVLEKNKLLQESILDVSSLSPGLYFVKIISNKGSVIKKMIKI